MTPGIDTAPNPEIEAESFVAELRDGLQSQNKEKVVAVLKKIGDKVNQAWGKGGSVSTAYDAMSSRYALYLGSGTKGTRIFINERYNHPYKIIFPNAGYDTTLAQAFTKVFGSRAQNTGSDQEPYFVVDLGIEVPEQE